MIDTIFWDFDGVIMNSMPIRDKGFELVLRDYPANEVSQLLAYHRLNGGLSRYVKFRYFLEKIRGEEATEEQVRSLANQFSQVMLANLNDRSLLIQDTLQFIQMNEHRYNMHIVSGSDQNELRNICAALGLKDYFLTVNGSPSNKQEILKRLFKTFGYQPESCVFVGDSINDFEAARAFSVFFIGYNNPTLKPTSDLYLNSFRNFEL